MKLSPIIFSALALVASVGLRAQAAPPKIYAQVLVDYIVAHHPELDKVSIHTFAPGASVSSSGIIAAKDTSKWGDPDDQEDFDVLTLGKPNIYYAKEQGLFKALLPLHDITVRQIGTITLAFKYTTKEAEPKMADAMVSIRDQIKVYIPSHAALFETGRSIAPSYAQSLVDYVVATHPELVRISLHVPAPGTPISRTYVIAGKDLTSRHLPMLGAFDDAEDFLPLTSGKPSFFNVKDRGFFKGILPLRDRAGQSIGVILLAVTPPGKEEEEKVSAAMTDIRNQLQVNIPDLVSLFRAAQ